MRVFLFSLCATLGAALACESYQHQPALLPASSTAELSNASAPQAFPSASAPPSAAGAAPAKIAIEDPNQIHTAAPILFETGSDKVRDSDPALKALAESLKSSTEITLVRIEDHVDEQGLTPGGAIPLSQRRAMNVAKKLAGLGVDCERLLPVGFGAVRAERGLVLMKAAVRGKPIGGPVAGGGNVAGDPCR